MAREHPIQRYCAEHGLTQREFARRVPCSAQHITDIIVGRKFPSHQLIRALVAATGGEITITQLYAHEPERHEEGAA